MASGPTAATLAATTAMATAATSTKAATAVPQMASEPTAAILPVVISLTAAAAAAVPRKNFDWTKYRTQKYYKEQLKKLGRCHKIIEHWVGSRFTGRFESAIQVCGMGLIKPYGARNTHYYAVVAKKNELDDTLFLVKRECIKIREACSYGPRKFPATALTGAIDFGTDDNSRHILVDHYNKVSWYSENEVTSIDNTRKRKEPNRDLKVSDTITKYKSELTMNIEKRSIRRVQKLWEDYSLAGLCMIGENRNELGGALSELRELPTNVAHVHKMISNGLVRCAWKAINYLDKVSCRRGKENTKREKAREAEVSNVLLEYSSAGTGMSYAEAKNRAESEVRPVEYIMEEELEYDVLEETAKMEWNNHTNRTKESEMYNFELSMMWEKLTGRRKGVLKQVYFCTLEIEDDTPMDIFAGVNVRNRQLLKKQANKKVKSSAQKLCKRNGCESKVNQISHQVCCCKHSDRKYLCISCKVRSAGRNNLCKSCDANGEQKVQNICAQCKCRKVRNRKSRCNICSMEDKCSKCKVRAPKCVGLLCFKCFEANGGVRKKCVKCKTNLPRCKGGLCRSCSKNS
mgnify:CR=1 FL=1